MPSTIKKLQVPFDKHGNMQHCARTDSILETYDGPFEATMRFHKFYQNRSIIVIMRDQFERTHYMSFSEFERIIRLLDKGYLSGKFYFHKQGQYFNIRYLEDDADI